MDLNIGIEQVEFGPEIGLPIMGHLRKNYASTGFHDPLYSKAIVFADGTAVKFAIISLDLCMITAEQVGILRRLIAENTGMDGGNILVAATHTHGGPATVGLYTAPKAPDEKIEQFLARAAKAVSVAIDNLQPSEINVGYAQEERLAFNRRLKTKAGQTLMNWETLPDGEITGTWGPIDPQVGVVAIQQNGQSVSAIVNYALHTAILDYENQKYTADFPGYLSEAMQNLFDKDFITLFLNGCCGNINHLDYESKSSPRKGFEMAQRCGYMLGVNAFTAINQSELCAVDRIDVSSEKVESPRFQIGDDLYQEDLDIFSGQVEEVVDTDGLPVHAQAKVWKEMREQQDSPDYAEVMVARIGELAIVGIPGEMFCELGLIIKRESPSEHTIVVELANDAIGYLPTEEAFTQGGYEVTPGACCYAPGCGEKLIESTLNQLNILFKQ